MKQLPTVLMISGLMVSVVVWCPSPVSAQAPPNPEILPQIEAVNRNPDDFFERGREQFELEIQRLQAGTYDFDGDILELEPKIRFENQRQQFDELEFLPPVRE